MIDKIADSEILELHKLESYQDYLRNPENVGQRGVYIWGFLFVDPKTAIVEKFLPYYVGRRVDDIYKRIQEHVYGIKKGTHKILLTDRLAEKEPWKYFRYNADDVCHYVYINYGETKTDKIKLTTEIQLKIQPHVDFYLENLYITYISINKLCRNINDEVAYINYLERYVQDKIGLDRLASRPGNKYPDSFKPTIHTAPDTEHLFSPDK